MPDNIDPISGDPVDTTPGTPNWVAAPSPDTSGTDWGSFLKNVGGMFTGTTGGMLGQLAAFGGLAGLLNQMSSADTQKPVGYQGGIPLYTATRQQLTPPVSSSDDAQLRAAIRDSLNQGFTLPQIQMGAQRKFGISPDDVTRVATATNIPEYRRPGAGGITYFTPMTYEYQGRDIGQPVTTGGGSAGTAPPATNVPATGGISTLPTPISGPGALDPTQRATPTPAQLAAQKGIVADPQAAALAAAQYGLDRGMTSQQIADMVNAKYGKSFSAKNIEDFIAANNLKADPTQAPTPSAVQMLQQLGIASNPQQAAIDALKSGVSQGLTPDQIAQKVNTQYGKNFTAQNVMDFAKSNNLPLIASAPTPPATPPAPIEPAAEPIQPQAAPKYSDDQVASAIRASLQQGFSAADTLAKAEQLGATPDQLARARAALKQSGYASGGFTPSMGIATLAKGRFLRGPGDGVSDSIPAQFQSSGQPARLADGEFVLPARVVSELGNGSSEAGARKLYAMMDRVERVAKKAKRGKDSKADKYLPA